MADSSLEPCATQNFSFLPQTNVSHEVTDVDLLLAGDLAGMSGSASQDNKSYTPGEKEESKVDEDSGGDVDDDEESRERRLEETLCALRMVKDERGDLWKRQKELEKRVNELRGYPGSRENNLPPFPKWFPCKPCFHHNIKAEIPVVHQKTCQHLYYRWHSYWLQMAFNSVFAMGLYISVVVEDHNGLGAATFGLSLFYLVFTVPASFLAWYMPAYRAMKSDKSLSFAVFFLFFSLHIVLSIFYCLGVPGSGACGFINGIQAINKDNMLGFVILGFGITFLVGIIADICFLYTIYVKVYCTGDASWEKATRELKEMVHGSYQRYRECPTELNC